MVEGWTPNSRAASAAVFFPEFTSCTISAFWLALSSGRIPPIRPCLRAADLPHENQGIKILVFVGNYSILVSL